ncbi:hypothetical protein [Falsibacillus pallidus]|uniref:Uncharacterized protein n=1 Tax=Falsibacillus pallidus TaxID=493781 RepID=A0A370GQU9_9BACI|nr:hypothetical protein [Falsibacillus pallidus]RDI45690.1 hypothetical protein DFR59_102322 [Falsibacillus pallidus]
MDTEERKEVKRELTKGKIVWIAVVVLILYAASLYFFIGTASRPLWLLLLSTFNCAVFLKASYESVRIKSMILFSLGTLFFATASIMTIFHLG